ncbi:CapA family protein [bacterium]|nr:CapA family protein [bacterium]
MPVIHYFSDKERKKLNSRIIAFILFFIGALATTYAVASLQVKPVATPIAPIKTKYFCAKNLHNEKLTAYIETLLEQQSIDLVLSSNSQDCTVTLQRNPLDINTLLQLTHQLYIPVVSAINPLETINTKDLISSLNQQKYKGYSLIWNSSTDSFLRSRYNFGVGQTVYSDSEIERKLGERGNYLAIIPFEQLNPKYKVVQIEAWDIFEPGFTISTYPLTDSYWLNIPQEYKPSIQDSLTEYLPKPNYEPAKLTKIILTGSSYIGADAYNIQILSGKNPNYMLKNLTTFIGQEDLLHISNEVSINTNCIQQVQSTFLCSKEKDFTPFKILGVDVVGVTGNHIMDFGYNTYINTLNWYDDNKIKYFGGGRDAHDAHTPRVITQNGIKFAFLGYNFIPPFSYYSTNNKGGSANVSLKFMETDITKAKQMADVVIVDMHWGDELQQRISRDMRENARYAHQYGATIVNGVNSYSTLGFDVSTNTSTFYGMGGFLNPQAENGMIVSHYFYNKEYIGAKVSPITYTKDKTVELAEGKIKDRMISTVYKQSKISYD